LKLEKLGWNSAWAEAFAIHARPEAAPGRVVSDSGALAVVETEDGERTLPHAANCLRPVTGDWVAVSRERIEQVLPRRTRFSRRAAGERNEEQVLAANIDVAFLVMGLDGDYNLRRIERYLLSAWQSGARPVVVLNKADICPDWPARVAAVERSVLGVPVVAISATEDPSLAPIAGQVKSGETAALFGSSGVGKSTLVNRLLGAEKLPTRPVRQDDSRGRHTTTRRSLTVLPEGWLLIDMPGLRELRLWADEEALNQAFADVDQLARQCRFRDCRHNGEPGCAVTGSLEEGRLASYHKLQREIEYLDRKEDPAAEAALRKKWRNIHKTLKHHPKYRNE